MSKQPRRRTPPAPRSVAEPPELVSWSADAEDRLGPVPPRETVRQDEPHGSGKGLVRIAGGLAGVFTGIGTVAGAIAYAVLWNAYASFYSAFGLTPEEVGLSRERLLIPAGLTALLLIGVLVLVSLSGVSGYRVMPDRLIVTRLSGLTAVAFCLLAVLIAVSLPLSSNQAGFVLAAVWLAVAAFGVGALLAVLRWDFDQTYEWQEIAYVLVVVGASVGYGVLASLLSGWLTGHEVPAAAQGVLLGAPAAVTFALMLTRWRPAWSEELSERESRAKPAPRRRRLPASLVAASLATVLAVWGLTEVSAWSSAQRNAGARAIELGYRDSSLTWLDPRIRPIFVRQLDADSDPVGVCGDSPSYAASLIGQDPDGWWVLLRAPEDFDGVRARVVWLRRDTYAIDLAPMAAQPKKPGTGDHSDAGAEERLPWHWPACV